MVGSCDPNAAIYNVEVRLQWPKPEEKTMVKEVIEKTEEMVVSLLRKFNMMTRYTFFL